MQRQGSQAVVTEVKKMGEGSEVFDSCCLLMHLTDLWGELGNVWMQNCHGFGIFSVACCVSTESATIPHSEAAPVLTTRIGMVAHTTSKPTFRGGLELSIFIPWLLLHRCAEGTPGFLPWCLRPIPTYSFLCGIWFLCVSAAVSEHGSSSAEGLQ